MPKSAYLGLLAALLLFVDMIASTKVSNILIVDDEPNVRFILERTLAREGYALDCVADGYSAIKQIENKAYDLILLDLNLGDMSGLKVLEKARSHDENLVVIILTGQGSLNTAVSALRLGALDYLFKPAQPETIRQRVREGIQQRNQALQQQQIVSQIESLRQVLTQIDPPNTSRVNTIQNRFIRSETLVVDRHHRAVTQNDSLLNLTSTEFDLLVCLIQAAPAPISARKLLNTVLGYDADEKEAKDTIKWHIHHLRRKIESNAKQPNLIKTVRYKGYMWAGTILK